MPKYVKLQVKKTGKIYMAEECYGKCYHDNELSNLDKLTGWQVPLEEIIERHNSIEAHKSTGLPVKWEQENSDRISFLSTRYYSNNYCKYPRIYQEFFQGYYIKNKCKKNANRSFSQLLQKDSVRVL